MTIMTSVFGAELGLNHNRQLVANLPPKLTGYTTETFYGLEGLQKTTISSAQVLALNATPITIVSAAPSGFANVFYGVAIYKPAGTAYAGVAAGEDLVVKQTDAAGQQLSSVIETTGFLDQTTAQIRYAYPTATTGATAGDVTPRITAQVLHLLVGEVITGDSPLIVWTWFRRLPLVLTNP